MIICDRCGTPLMQSPGDLTCCAIIDTRFKLPSDISPEAGSPPLPPRMWQLDLCRNCFADIQNKIREIVNKPARSPR